MFPNGEKPVKITLYKNVPFNNSYSDHFFRPSFNINGVSKTKIPMKIFLNANSLVPSTTYMFPKTQLTGDYNFAHGNGLITSIILELDSEWTSSNYMMVEVANEDPLYFFITQITELSSSNTGVNCKLELELDVLATYDEDIMTSLQDMPLMTERKHCQRYGLNGKMQCNDIFNVDPMFSGLQPNILSSITKLTLKNDFDCNFIYISGTWENHNKTTFNKIGTLPIGTMFYPIGSSLNIKLKNANGSVYDDVLINGVVSLNNLFDDPANVSIKVSPYPPSSDITPATLENGSLVIPSGKWTEELVSGRHYEKYRITLNKLTFELEKSDTYWKVYLMSQGDNEYEYNDILKSFPNKPTINTSKNKIYEPILYCTPFKKYHLTSYYSDGNDIKMEYLLSNKLTSNSYTISFKTIATSYGGDSCLFTYFTTTPNTNYQYNKTIIYGINGSPSYNLPVGTNALKEFMQTQYNQYQTSRLSAVVGGSTSVAMGAVSAYTGNYVGAINNVVNGVTNMATSLMSSNAKIEDLKKTPTSITTMGSNLIHDISIDEELLPYICEYSILPTDEETILDYYYNNGYIVNRECYFNSNLSLSQYENDTIDKRLFTRMLFNYIKTNDNIVNKLYKSYILSPIIKEKIENIFNNGIKLWTLFEVDGGGETIKLYNDINKYLLKDEYENVEII